MIHITGLSLAYGERSLFDNLSCTFQDAQRVGLVGRNGSGKSTFLKILAGQLKPDKGVIQTGRGTKIAYMPQDVVLTSSRSIFDETIRSFGAIAHALNELEELEPIIMTADSPDIHERYAAAHEQLAQAGFENLKVRARIMLNGLGFSEQQLSEPVSSLSTGWKMRIILAQLLLQDADFYLFDEPTNHLDIFAKEWFVSFLKTAPFGFLLVCHEQYVMDTLCTHILELELGKGTMYTGTYAEYEEQKHHQQAIVQAAYEQQKKDISRKQATIERFRAGTKSVMAKSMEKALAKVERIELPPEPPTIAFNFPTVDRSGRIVLSVEQVGQAFQNRKIFDHVSFKIERGQKVALVAANGVGKTTLFRIITGQLPRQQGTIEFGSNVRPVLFAQDQSEVLDGNRSIFDNVHSACPKATDQTIRTSLGAFLFSGNDALKKVSVLSGGEKNRVGMVCTLLHDANFLLLDEPTNHLDIPSKRVLLKTLQKYPGTMLFVSHDRDFINGLATHILVLTPTGAHVYPGSYDDYLRQTEMTAAATRPSVSHKKVAAPQAASSSAQKEVRLLERQIEELEHKIKLAEQKFAHLEYGAPSFTDAEQKLRKLQNELEVVYTAWEAKLKDIS